MHNSTQRQGARSSAVACDIPLGAGTALAELGGAELWIAELGGHSWQPHGWLQRQPNLF